MENKAGSSKVLNIANLKKTNPKVNVLEKAPNSISEIQICSETKKIFSGKPNKKLNKPTAMKPKKNGRQDSSYEDSEKSYLSSSELALRNYSSSSYSSYDDSSANSTDSYCSTDSLDSSVSSSASVSTDSQGSSESLQSAESSIRSSNSNSTSESTNSTDSDSSYETNSNSNRYLPLSKSHTFIECVFPDALTAYQIENNRLPLKGDTPERKARSISPVKRLVDLSPRANSVNLSCKEKARKSDKAKERFIPPPFFRSGSNIVWLKKECILTILR